MKEIYKAKGYSDDWIEKRVRGIAIRDELTDEWKKRKNWNMRVKIIEINKHKTKPIKIFQNPNNNL